MTIDAQPAEAVKRIADEYAHAYAFVGDDTMPVKRKELHAAIDALASPAIAPPAQSEPSLRERVETLPGPFGSPISAAAIAAEDDATIAALRAEVASLLEKRAAVLLALNRSESARLTAPVGVEPVAFVPIHPRTGPLWANTVPSLDNDRPSYPTNALVYASALAQLQARLDAAESLLRESRKWWHPDPDGVGVILKDAAGVEIRAWMVRIDTARTASAKEQPAPQPKGEQP